MDLKKIQELIKLVKKSDICELKVKEGDFAISIKNKGGETVYTTSVATPVVTQAAVSSPKSEIQNQKLQETPKAEVINENIITFRSPMVGTFYRKPGADKEPYVKVGDVIKGGDVLCIIEAMKLFNEIESEVKGRIVKVLVDDASPVEYDQPLFLVDPA